MKTISPAKQLDQFIARFTPEIAALARQALKKLRKLLPPAIEMVYDNYNALVIGFCPSVKPSEAIFSIVVYPRKVSLCFLQGKKVPDPQKRLKGDGNQVRHIPLDRADVLDLPAVQELVARACQSAKVPFDGTMKRTLIIKSIAVNQRPRRPS